MNSHPLKRRLAGALAVGALLIASLAGCLKMEVNLVLNEDRADGSVIFAVDKEFLALLDEFEEPGAEGSTPSEEFLAGFNEGLEGLEDATVEEYEDDQYIGSRYVFDDMPLSELQEGSEEELSITYDPAAKTYEVTGIFDMTDMADSGGGEDALPPGLEQQMLESFDIVISITFPGEVREHNGELDGTTVTWRPAVGEATELYALASSEPASAAGSGPAGSSAVDNGSSSTTVALVVALAVLVVGVAAGLGFWFLLRRRSPAEAAAGAGTTDTLAAPPPPGSEG